MPKVTDWSKYNPLFTKVEFDCRETGENGMEVEFMDALMALRIAYGKPMKINSGFRSVKHSREIRKKAPGTHTEGIAADIACYSDQAFVIAKLAFEHGFTGIGVSQAPTGGRFLHLDRRPGTPVLYSY